MASGQATLAEIERAIADVRESERRLQSELEGMNGERTKLLEARTQTFRELAEVRTRHALADGVIDEADGLQQRVGALLAARQSAVADLKTASHPHREIERSFKLVVEVTNLNHARTIFVT